MLKKEKLSNGRVTPHFDIDDMFFIDSTVHLQIIFNASGDFEPIDSFEIGDEDGKDLYTGKDINKAFDAVKSKSVIN